jgi:hypothetical protein
MSKKVSYTNSDLKATLKPYQIDIIINDLLHSMNNLKDMPLSISDRNEIISYLKNLNPISIHN